MNITEAKQECERWLAYLERQKQKTVELGKIASDRRNGRCTEHQARARVSALDSGVTVYDGAKLADAVRLLLKEIAAR
jgi:hypothetical protein